MKKSIKVTGKITAAFVALFFAACSTEPVEKFNGKETDTSQETITDVYDADKSIQESNLDAIVFSKYANDKNDAWGCHDPKLFQDDDGTYYVYSTGWQGGVQLRSSKDLVNWKNENFSITEWDSEFRTWVSSSGGSWAPTVVKQNSSPIFTHVLRLRFQTVQQEISDQLKTMIQKLTRLQHLSDIHGTTQQRALPILTTRPKRIGTRDLVALTRNLFTTLPQES